MFMQIRPRTGARRPRISTWATPDVGLEDLGRVLVVERLLQLGDHAFIVPPLLEEALHPLDLLGRAGGPDADSSGVITGRGRRGVERVLIVQVVVLAFAFQDEVAGNTVQIRGDFIRGAVECVFELLPVDLDGLVFHGGPSGQRRM